MRLASVVLPLLVGTVVCTAACTSTTDRGPSKKAVPQHSQLAEVIVDRFRNDPRLGDDLFNDKVVEIVSYRVDDIQGTSLIMKDRGFTLRLEDIVPGAIKKGDVITLVCEGDGMHDETTIVFEDCAAP